MAKVKASKAEATAALRLPSSTKGPLWDLHKNVLLGRVMKRKADGRRGVVMFPITTDYRPENLFKHTYNVRWAGTPVLDPSDAVAGADVKAGLTDEFANEPYVPAKVLDLQQNNWFPLKADFVRERLPPVAEEVPLSMRPSAAHVATSATAAAPRKRALPAPAKKLTAAAAAAAAAAGASAVAFAALAVKPRKVVAVPKPAPAPRAGKAAAVVLPVAVKKAVQRRAAVADKGKAPAVAAKAAVTRAKRGGNPEAGSAKKKRRTGESFGEGQRKAAATVPRSASASSASRAAGGGRTVLSVITRTRGHRR